MTHLTSRISIVLLVAIAFTSTLSQVVGNNETRSLRGTIYFSNNTPSNLGDFPVELLTIDQKTRIAETTLTATGNFYLLDIKPGKYLLKITNPSTCVLTYRVDLRKQSITNIRVVMDAACAHVNGKIAELPRN